MLVSVFELLMLVLACAFLRVGGACEQVAGAYGSRSDHEERRVEDGDVSRALHLVDQAYTAPKRGTDNRTTTGRPRAGCRCRRPFNWFPRVHAESRLKYTSTGASLGKITKRSGRW